MTFNTSLDNYNISAALKSGNDNLTAINIIQSPIDSDRIQDADITASNFTGCNIVRMTPRGLVEHCATKPSTQSDTGSVTITNSRGATATVSISERGRVYVTFSNL